MDDYCNDIAQVEISDLLGKKRLTNDQAFNWFIAILAKLTMHPI